MAFVGGDLTEVTWNHPTLGSGSLYVKANEDSTFDKGGFRSNDDENMITGDGQFIDQMNRVRPSIELTGAWDMNTVDELQQMTDLAGSPELTDFTITSISGAIFGIKGKPVGDLQGAGNGSTFTLKIAGTGVMTKIS